MLEESHATTPLRIRPIVMQKRYLYALMFGVPGFFLALLFSFWVLSAVVGGMWVFLFGDDVWPETVVRLLPVFFGVVLLAVWVLVVIRGYLFGKNQETVEGFNRAHLGVAAALTIAPLLLILFQQWGVSNFGPQSDGQLCSDFCLERGFNGSGMPPRISGDRSCFCLDENGNEVLRIPVLNIPVASE